MEASDSQSTPPADEQAATPSPDSPVGGDPSVAEPSPPEHEAGPADQDPADPNADIGAADATNPEQPAPQDAPTEATDVPEPPSEPTDAPADVPEDPAASEEPAPEVPVNAPEPAAPREGVQPVRVDNYSRRSDEDALEGGWVLVVGGEHAGQKGSFIQALEYSPENGYPTKILVRFRDATYSHEYASIAYDDVRPAGPYNGGR